VEGRARRRGGRARTGHAHGRGRELTPGFENRQRAAERFHLRLIATLSAITIVAHVLGATRLPGTLWGTNLYGFLPPSALVIALGLTLAAVVVAWRAPAARHPAGGPRGIGRIALWAAIAALAAALLWWLRIRHTLLGDAGPLTHNLPLGERTHARQPLSLLLHHHVFEWTRGLFEGPARTIQEVARETVALNSVAAGVLLVPVAWGLARHLVRATPGPAVRGQPPGYMQLFFGYVENYTWFTVGIAVYLWAGMSHLAGRTSLVPAALALAAAIGLNTSGIILLPSLVALALPGLLRHERRRAALRDVVLALGIFAGLQLLLAALGGFSWREAFRYMWDLVIGGEATDRSGHYVWSWPHLRDFIAVQLLIGPFAGFLLVPATLHRLAQGAVRDERLLFLLAAAVPPFVAVWLYGDSIQGIPRDWDLFAPFGLPFLAAALYCMASVPLRPAALRRLLMVATLVSCFHTGSWVALNTSEARSLERYKSLPASKGRTEMVVGYWYLTHGQKEVAREWFQRAIAAYPGNNVAHHHLGLFAVDEGRYADAVAHFEMAVRARPDKHNYRLSLVDALVLAGRPAEALPHLEVLTTARPERAPLWGCAGVVLSGLGRIDEARSALTRAGTLAPADSIYPRLLRDLTRADAYARAVAEHWDALVLE
jgi:tetratricopeptide (TPR) repeat protein